MRGMVDPAGSIGNGPTVLGDRNYHAVRTLVRPTRPRVGEGEDTS